MTTSPQTLPEVPVKSYRDRYLYSGYALLLISFLFFVLIEFTEINERSNHLTIFALHYLLAIVYIGILLSGRSFGLRRSWKEDNLSKTIVLAQLLLISAYALNREIPVFDDSPNWLCVYLLILSFNTLTFHYFDRLPLWLNRAQYFILGSSLAFYLYLTVYVGEYFPVGAIGILFFGIGGHIFVPLLLLAISGFVIFHFRQRPISYRWIIAGLIATLLYTTAFIYTWSVRIDKIESIVNQSVLEQNQELPVWVKVGQTLNTDWITERLLKSDLVYQTSNESSNSNFLPQSTSWEERKKHDPLVFLASVKSKLHLTAEDRVKILGAISDHRHKSNERLWSGDNLTTSYIISDVDIYPDLRLSYTEKYITIRNNAKQNLWWGNTEEAIYTFELPEGSVITSLSLWINGKEEKGIMTSKQKAAKAYKQIVGVEQRDPSVVQWQEGNTVTVRVFPCTSQEERKFKIGITSPLEHRDDKIIYRSVTFLGPNANVAKETIRFRTPGIKTEDTFSGFKAEKNGYFIREAGYDPNFELALTAVPLKKDNHFIFQDHAFSLSDYTPIYSQTIFDKIYLDINNTWTDEELSAMKEWMLSKRSLYIFNEQSPVLLTDENWSQAMERQKWNFSLFPFHLIENYDHSLVITKGKPLSPHLSDFRDSEFATSISNFFQSKQKVYVYNIGPRSSTYINSLRELRAFHFAKGKINQLEQWLKEGAYPKVEENEEQIILHQPNLVLSKKRLTDSLISNAPDHLARLFAYNNILRQVGTNYFQDDFVNQSLIHEATTAYVVSPVSSLIVLESAADYKRFDITDNEESLKNASKQSAGAVPEPHEWALIILFALFILFILFKKSHV